MKSIKRKLFLAILLIFSLFLIGIISYALTFKSYFINEKVDEMITVAKTIDSYFSSNNLATNTQYISDVSDKYNFKIQIIGKDGLIYGNHGMGMGNPYRFDVIETIDSGSSTDIAKTIILDHSTGVKFLNVTLYNSRLPISIKTPISAIEDSLNKSIKLLATILTPIIVLIFIATFYFSKSFTKPIIEITNKASKIERLDFSDSIKINSKDELSHLASTINNLSSTIEITLNELKTKNIKLQEHIEKEEKNEVLRKEFVSSVSHELKTPITVISGYSQALDSGVLTNDEDKAYYLNVIQNEAQRMEVIVNDLLDLYKLESNTFKLKVEIIQLDELLTNIINKLSFKFADFEVNLTTNIEKCQVTGDAIRLEQAIVNYINNALYHLDENKLIDINLININGTIKLSVFNSGENIPYESLDKIWKGFFRIDKVRNFKENRVGLGLAIVGEIVKLHGGEKGVINKPNGVEFWLSFPSHS